MLYVVRVESCSRSVDQQRQYDQLRADASKRFSVRKAQSLCLQLSHDVRPPIQVVFSASLSKENAAGPGPPG